MKSNLLKSIFISLILVMGVANMSAATITSDGTARLYFNMSAVSWWTAGTNGNGNFGYFFNNSTGKNAWSAHSVNYSGNTYYVVIPAGTWAGVILTRNNTSTAPSWENKWNQTGDITLSSTSNYISKFSENFGTVTWGTAVKPTSTGSLAASSTSVNIGANVTLTPSLTSNQTINDIKSTAYSISPSSGASINGNTFTATKAGTYTVTATITYNPDGYTSLTSTVSPTVTITVNPWTITWNPNGGSVTPTSSTYDGATAVSLPTPTRTGYNFDGWYTAASGGTKINDIGTTTKPTSNVTYYAHWTLKTYAITLNANGGASNGSATATYNSNTVKNATYPTRTDYRCNGYYTATSDGTLVLNTDGTLAKNVSGYTDANGNWIKDGTATLYAQWTYDVTEYAVTFGAGTGFTSYGSVTAYNNTTSAAITSSATVRSGQSITFTATPQTGYEVEGWYTNAACTAGKHDAGQTTYTTLITGATNVYVKFVEKTWSVAFTAGTGGTVTTPSSTPQTVGEVQGINIIAETNTGYTFAGWTSSNGGKFDDTKAEKTKFYPTAATTVTATATENMSTLTTSNSYTEGNPGYAAPIASVNSIGIATTATVTATAAGNGYTFTGWTLTNCTRTVGGAADATFITVRSNGDGKAATVVANYAEDLTSEWHLVGNGNIFPDGWTVNNNSMMRKISGKSTESIVALKVNVTTVQTYEFKIVDDNGSASDTWYGYSTGNTFLTWTATSTKNVYSGDNNANNLKFTPKVAGEYEFKVDYSGEYPAVTITYPTAYKITYGVGTNEGTDAVTTNPNIKSGASVLASTEITFSKGETKAGYTWKNWNSEADGTGTNLGTGETYVSSNRTGDISVYACYDLITYDITYNLNGGTNPNDAPTSYNITTTTFNLPTTPTKTGYTFAGWYTTSDFSDNKVTQIAQGSTDDKEFWAKWTATEYTITYNDLYDVTHSNPTAYTIESETITFTNPTSERTGYTFAGWNPTQITKGSTGNQAVSAQWTANTYTVELDQEGAAKPGSTTSVDANFEGNMPAITGDGALPTPPNGYAFMGYFDQKDGKGTQYYDSIGTSAHVWDKTENDTLYAYFKAAEITIGLNAASFEPNSATPVIATATLTPTPGGTTSICWSLLYNGSENEVAGHEPQQTGKPNQVQFNINDLATGTYQIKATLREGTGCTGTIISHATQVFTITSDHTITIKYVDENGQTIKASTTQSAHVSSLTEITAPEIIGYNFKEWEAGDGVSIKDATDGKKNTATIEFTAYYDGYLTAKYTKDNNIIYFNNVNLKWNDVYVYFYKGDFWNNDNGTGAIDSDGNGSYEGYVHMTKIEGTDIWYAKNTYNNISQIAFSPSNQNGKQYFNCSEAVRCWSFDTRLPMYVPIKAHGEKKNNTTTYYNKGYWMNYPENTGYTLRLFSKVEGDGTMDLASIPFEYSENKDMPMSIEVELGANQTYGFKIYSADDKWRGNNSIMTSNNSTNWEMSTETKNCGLTTTIAGKYTFVINYRNTQNSDYNYSISVKFPGEEGDYRVIYTDNGTTNWSGTNRGTGWYHPSRLIQKKDVDTKETISFFVNHDKKPKLQIQKLTITNGGIEWENIGEEISVDINEDKVYNFTFRHAEDKLEYIGNIEPYTGNYYVRSYALDGKWHNYLIDNDNRMTYSAFSESDANSFGEKYSHYVTKYCPHGTNIKFTVANDYSPCISDTLVLDYGADNTTTNPFGNLKEDGTLETDGSNNDKYSANVRFMWNRTTNKISRAYIGRAVTNDFLVIKGNKKLQKGDSQTLQDTIVFFDTQNWIYEVKMKVQPQTRVKVYAAYPAGAGESGAQYFCGTYNTDSFTDDKDSKLALGGDANDQNYYSIRVLYDFKTNRLLMAWMPSGDTENVDSTKTISADVMLIRDHQNPAQCITFANEESKLSDVKTVYGSMRFNRWVLNNRGGQDNLDAKSCGGADSYNESTTNSNHPVLQPKDQKSQYERALYFISFPFDVNVSDIFGFGTYGQHWIIEYYDGLKRAREGYWIDSDPNWKYVTNPDEFVLEKYKGYILCLNLGKMAYNNTDFWAHNISQVELFFPSTTTMSEIKRTEVTMPELGEEYLCKINRNTPEGDRRVKDSYWRCIGVPSYANYSNILTDGEQQTIQWQTSYTTFPFLYAWNMTDNTLTPQSTTNFNFKTMHAYLVQNGGKIHWSAVSATPKPSNIVARRQAADEVKNYEWKLTLSRNEQIEDQTFVRLSDNEQITTEFDFNQDLSKEFNYGRSDIYTLIGYEKAAANSLPITETTTLIPLGLSIEYNGDYTIAMPDRMENIGVTLIDTESNTRTNLSAGMEYVVTLNKGDYNNRFFIEISPAHQVPTDIEYVTGDSNSQDSVRKVLIDNILYIVRDGQMFDARGARVQ